MYTYISARMCKRERTKESEKERKLANIFFSIFIPNRPAPDSWYKDSPMLPKCSFNWNSLTRVSVRAGVASTELKGVWSLGRDSDRFISRRDVQCTEDRETIVYVIYIFSWNFLKLSYLLIEFFIIFEFYLLGSWVLEL